MGVSFIFQTLPAICNIVDSNDKFPVRRILCVGANYVAHALEMGRDPTREPPFFFAKPSDAIVNADNLELDTNNINMVIKVGMLIKNSINNQVKILHPQESEMNFLYGTIFTFKPKNKNNHSRNICVFANGEIDRSPTGTGVSARAAVHYARDEISLDETITIESIIGSTFEVSVIEETKIGDKNAVIPQVVGTANIIGKNTFWIDPLDEKGQGFFLR